LKIDDIVWGLYRLEKIEKPVMIIGNPRSGTTFIQRVMSRDEDNYFYFRTWEILFPAVVQKKVLSSIGRIDRRFGGVLKKGVQAVESRLFREFNKMHRVSLFSPEEDDKLLIHIFSSYDLIWLIPVPEAFQRLNRFDEQVEAGERIRIMSFYKKCIQRQSFHRGRGRYFLSKNPFATTKIESLSDFFPGMRFILMIRNPLEMIPSMVHMAHEIVKKSIGLTHDDTIDEKVYETIVYYYRYSLARIDRMPEDSVVIIRYEDLIQNPSHVIQGIYERFGISLSQRFSDVLKKEEAKAKTYKSRHEYTLDDIRIPREQILQDLGYVMKRFNYLP